VKREETTLLLILYSTWFSIGIYALFLPLYAYYVVGTSNLLVGLLATIYFSVNASTSIIGGYAIDKYGDAKKLLLIALSMLFLSNVITPIYRDGYYLLFIRAIQGFSTAIIIPVVNLLSARLMKPGRGIGLVNSFGSLGFASAGIIGGILADYISYTSLFYIGGFTLLIIIILILTIPKEKYLVKGGRKLRFRDIREIHLLTWIIYLAYFLRFTAAGGIWSLFSLFLFSIGGTNLLVGLVNSINAFTQVALFKRFGELSEGRGLKIFKLGMILSIIVFSAYYFSNNIYQLMPFQAILGVAWVSLYAGANVYIIENTPKNIQGTALGLLNTFGSLSWIVGSILNGYLSDIFHSYRLYILIGIMITVLGYTIIELYERRNIAD